VEIIKLLISFSVHGPREYANAYSAVIVVDEIKTVNASVYFK
jgi:hypothetical protein